MIKIVPLLLIILTFLCCNQRSKSEKKKLEMKNESPVLLTAKLLTSEIHTGNPILIEVVLENISDSSVVINKRMSVGYKSSISRELFADLRYEGDDQDVPYYESDINRDFSKASDYIAIKPGKSLSETIDLMEFYTPKGPGKYVLTIYYQADEKMAILPENVLKNVYGSNAISFEVRSGMIEIEK